MKNVAVFLGTRPEAIKLAPVIKALEKSELFSPIVISTGQHREMLDQVVKIFNVKVDHDLEVMQPNQTLAQLTARIMQRTDLLLDSISPDIALVQGDTTTVAIASLACFYRKIPIAHVEAGLRTNNIYSPFPEEVNRRIATPMMDLHFSPTELSKENLLKENVDEKKIHVTGNTVVDALMLEIERQKNPGITSDIQTSLSRLLSFDPLKTPYILITGHRRENFGSGFDQICEALSNLAEKYRQYRFVYPVHLNPNVQKPVHSLLAGHDNISLLPPVDYSSFVYLMKHCHIILTDSGGVQEEAPSLAKPVLVMRDTTERPEGLESGTVKLIGAKSKDISTNVETLLENKDEYAGMARAVNPYGDGRASKRIVSILAGYFSSGNRSSVSQ